MKVLLVNPPSLEKKQEIVAPPLGLAYLAGVLERAGKQVEILDAFALGMDFNEVERELRSRKPDLVGVTGMTPIIESAFRTVNISRKYTRHIIFGGAHASALRKKVLDQCPDLDALMVGEAEDALLELVSLIEAGKDDWSGVPGLITRDFESSESPLIQNPDSLAFPARRLLPRDRYRHPLFGGEVFSTIISSRGCPYRCIFCDKSVAGRKWRPRSPENVLEEIEEIVNEHGIHSLTFYDDIFTLDPDRVIAICQGIIDRGIKIRWKCANRANLVNDEMYAWMYRAGCRQIAYGVETPHQKGLDYLKKGVKSEQITDAFRRTREAGMQTVAYFIMGIPVETFEDEIETISFARRLKPDYAYFGTLSPYPATELYDEAVEKGWYREIPAFAPSEQGTTRPMVITEQWNKDNLEKIVDRAYMRFYYRPGYIIKRILKTRSLRQLIDNILSARNLTRTTRGGMDFSS